eukprot:GHVN01003965.1.p2 GENE.GHVN01003965.1~~GHVN01003965.1.p2  ORF type:complete len:925 (+),score=9.25 GHVN01003965.1:446-3220(+)
MLHSSVNTLELLQGKITHVTPTIFKPKDDVWARRYYKGILESNYAPGTASEIRSCLTSTYEIQWHKKRIDVNYIYDFDKRKSLIAAYNTPGAGERVPKQTGCQHLLVLPYSNSEYRYTVAQREKMTEGQAPKKITLPTAGDSTYDIRALMFRLGVIMAKQSVLETMQAADHPNYARGKVYRQYVDFHNDVLEWAPLQLNTTACAYAGLNSPGSAYLGKDMVDTDSSVFAVLAGLLCSFGVNVYTDVVTTTHEGHLNIQIPIGEALVRAVNGAWSWLLGFAAEGGCATDAIFCWVCGLHSVSTVVAHSDEGAVGRDIFRSFAAGRPYGVFMGRFATYQGFSNPTTVHSSGRTSLALMVDNVLLTTAALFAVADPGMTGAEGSALPTVYTQPQMTAEPDVPRAQSLKLMDGFERFAVSYVSKLAAMMNSAGSGDALTISLFVDMVRRFAARGDHDLRHVKHRVLAPYYWVEPIHLFASVPKVLRSEGVCPLWVDGYNSAAQVPLFENTVGVEDVGSEILLTHQWTSYRRNGLWMVYSARANRWNGACQIAPHRTAPFVSDNHVSFGSAILLPGNTDLPDIGSVGWVRGHSAIPHPAEALCLTDNRMQWSWKHMTTATSTTRPNRLPCVNSALHEPVHFSVSRLKPTTSCPGTTCRLARMVSDAYTYLTSSENQAYSHTPCAGHKSAAFFWKERTKRPMVYGGVVEHYVNAQPDINAYVKALGWDDTGESDTTGAAIEEVDPGIVYRISTTPESSKGDLEKVRYPVQDLRNVQQTPDQLKKVRSAAEKWAAGKEALRRLDADEARRVSHVSGHASMRERAGQPTDPGGHGTPEPPIHDPGSEERMAVPRTRFQEWADEHIPWGQDLDDDDLGGQAVGLLGRHAISANNGVGLESYIVSGNTDRYATAAELALGAVPAPPHEEGGAEL